MAKLIYWRAESLDDHNCYSVRAKTKKEALRIRDSLHNPEDYGEVEKVVIEYKDAFDLLKEVLGEYGASAY